MDIHKLQEANRKLVSDFGAQPISTLKDVPDFSAFQRGLVYSHRDMNAFLKAVKAGKKCAIVSGVNASGRLHIGHKGVFDTVIAFQKQYGVDVFIPISDDESYVSKKIDSQQEALKNSVHLAKQLLGLGLDPKKTFIIIDQIYTNIYNLAIKLSVKVTMSEIYAVYGYVDQDNPGLFFYPAIQSAHVLLPNMLLGYEETLVPIGPDEDSHLRIARDIAPKFNCKKPAVLHLSFMPGLDGEKMSKSRNNTIYFDEDPATLKKKINTAFSGGQKTVEEHRRLGGDPTKDVAYFYLEKYFLDSDQAARLAQQYREGVLLSGQMKAKLHEHLTTMLLSIKKHQDSIKDSTVEKTILKNGAFERTY